MSNKYQGLVNIIKNSYVVFVAVTLIIVGGFFVQNAFATVQPPALSSITIKHSADKLTYNVGDSLDITGLEVTGTYACIDVDEYDVETPNSVCIDEYDVETPSPFTNPETITTANISNFDSSIPKVDQVLTITVGDKTTTYTVNIVAAPVIPAPAPAPTGGGGGGGGLSYIPITYTAGANGSITGISSQTVRYGLNGTEVTAVPAAGYYFVDWSDGSTTNPRIDISVTRDISVTANFAVNPTLGQVLGASTVNIEAIRNQIMSLQAQVLVLLQQLLQILQAQVK